MELTLADKAVIAKKNTADRKEQAANLRIQRREVQATIDESRRASPETEALIAMWGESIDFWKRELVASLQSRTSQGKSPQINIVSQDFLAYVLGDLIKDKLPELAALVCGSVGVSNGVRASQLGLLNLRLIEINAELAALGEY